MTTYIDETALKGNIKQGYSKQHNIQNNWVCGYPNHSSTDGKFQVSLFTKI